MQLVKIADTQFSHAPNSFGCGDLPNIFPQYFRWYRGNDNINDVIVITESCFHLTTTFIEKIKIALLLEPASIDNSSYQWIANNYHLFSLILTHHQPLLDMGLPNVQFYPFGGCWINPADRNIHPKTKNISIIASDKKHTEGHIFRHYIIEHYSSFIDGIYGRGYNPVENKIEALKDYRYSIVVENENSKCWFTEKLIDCFVTGTIPIYWGGENAITNSFFIYRFKNIRELDYLLREINWQNNYQFKQKIVQQNFLQAMQYTVPEDNIWPLIKPFLNSL